MIHEPTEKPFVVATSFTATIKCACGFTARGIGTDRAHAEDKCHTALEEHLARHAGDLVR